MKIRCSPKKKKKKKKVFAEIRRLFLAELTNFNGFSGQKQQLFPPKKKYCGGQETNRGGAKRKIGGAMPPCPLGDAPGENSSLSLKVHLRSNCPTWQCQVWHVLSFSYISPPAVADLGGGMGGCIPPTSLKVTILAEKSASVSNNSAPFRDASPPPPT